MIRKVKYKDKILDLILDEKWFNFLLDKNINYSKRFYFSVKVDGKYLLLHRLIINAKTGDIVDHINHNPMDNRECNLRLCTSSQNSMNRSKSYHKKYKGVSLDNRTPPLPNPWKAQIMLNYRNIHVGRFKTEMQAAQAYDEAAIKYFGEFADLNFKKGNL